jgi:7,8-dihydroneopterin aldolase/epimerase/oxygenase
MATDALRLLNMRFHAHHGLLPEENALGQWYAVDLEVHMDLGPAGRTDDVDRTLDYPSLYRVVEEVVTRRQFKLVEALAERIAEAVGRQFAPIEVTVRVRKPHPPVAANFDGLEVEIRRQYA